MIDFHSHILPDMDDGSDSVETSLEMLRMSKSQGITDIFATPHFYATEESPDDFLIRRQNSFEILKSAMSEYSADEFPKIYLGAEVLYFPGMSGCEELKKLSMGSTRTIMVEPPMDAWTESMISEIRDLSRTLKLLTIVAHVDRYMRVLEDDTLIDRVIDGRMLAQVNASFFIHEDSRDKALELLEENKIHVIGSDCHSLGRRSPNIGQACEIIRQHGQARCLARMTEKSQRLVSNSI